MARKKISKNKLNLFKILSILLIIILIIFIPVFIKKLIKIKTITCISQYELCPSDILEKLQLLENKDYRYVDREVEKILKDNYLLNDYFIQYQIPNKLLVELNIKKSKYGILNNSNKLFYLIDEGGVAIDTTNETNLPNIVKDEINYKFGENVTVKDKFALEIVEKVAYLYSVKVGTINNDELLITLKEGVLVRFPLEGDVDSLIGALRLIFSRLNDESQGIRMNDIKEIDLRFKNPVLR